MDARVRRILLAVGLAFGLVLLVPRLAGARLPGDHTGYSPDQPIAFSHRLHAGEMEIPCLYCHAGAERSRHAGIPEVSVCMNCHRFVHAPFAAVRAEDERAQAEGRDPRPVVSPEIRKILAAAGLGADLRPDPARDPEPIRWKRIHRLPDFATFDHRAHAIAGVTCQRCHGPVETMERVRQFSDLTMGWCLDCHRHPGLEDPDRKGTLDCAACHY